jgi:hypothetical protein
MEITHKPEKSVVGSISSVTLAINHGLKSSPNAIKGNPAIMYCCRFVTNIIWLFVA